MSYIDRNGLEEKLVWVNFVLIQILDCRERMNCCLFWLSSMDISQVIIDSQPLTVAVLAALLFGESIGIVGAAGLVLGVVGLVLLEVF